MYHISDYLPHTDGVCTFPHVVANWCACWGCILGLYITSVHPPTRSVRGCISSLASCRQHHSSLLPYCGASPICICIAGDSSYYTNVNVYYQLHNNLENDNDDELITDWDNLFWASNVLLANITDSGAFHQASQSFLQKWVCGSGGTVR